MNTTKMNTTKMNTTKQLVEQLEKLTNKRVFLKENTLKYLGSTGNNLTEVRFFLNTETNQYYRDPHPLIDDGPSKHIQKIDIVNVPTRFRQNNKNDLKFLKDWNNGGLSRVIQSYSINDFENARKYFEGDIEALKMLEVIIENFDDVKAKVKLLYDAWSLLFDKAFRN